MKTFIVEFRLKSGNKDKMIALFELQGPNRSAGVFFRNAWIGTRSELIFVLCESADEASVKQACQKWSDYGEHTIHPVIQHEQY
jgi:hypothetical protein